MQSMQSCRYRFPDSNDSQNQVQQTEMQAKRLPQTVDPSSNYKLCRGADAATEISTRLGQLLHIPQLGVYGDVSPCGGGWGIPRKLPTAHRQLKSQGGNGVGGGQEGTT